MTLMFGGAGAIIIGASLVAMAWGMGGLLNQEPLAQPVEVVA